MTATPNNPLSPATSASDTEQRYHAGGAFAMKERALETASNVQQASGEAVVLDTTGTGIPTVETHDAIDKTGPSVEQPAPVVAATQATDATGAKEGPLARITPEADEQTDGKGRKLTTIDAEIIAETNRIWAAINALRSANGARFDHIEQWMRDDARPEFDAIDKRADAIAGRVEYVCGRLIDVESKLDRLIAGCVSKPCEPSKATGENELATAVEGADWREALVPVRLDDDTMVWWMTPDCKYYSANYTDPTCGWGNVQNTLDALKTASTVPHVAYQTRDALPEPPNLREWWPVKADDFKPTPEQQRFLASVCESCRAVVRAMLAKGDIPGVVKTNQS